jgi:hypothetical protein
VLSKDTTLVGSSIAASDGKAPEKPSKPSSLKPVKEDIPPEIKVTIKDIEHPPPKKSSWICISIIVCIILTAITAPILVIKFHIK